LNIYLPIHRRLLTCVEHLFVNRQHSSDIMALTRRSQQRTAQNVAKDKTSTGKIGSKTTAKSKRKEESDTVKTREGTHNVSKESVSAASRDPESPDDDSSNAVEEMLQRLQSAIYSMNSVVHGLSEKIDIKQEEMEHRFGELEKALYYEDDDDDKKTQDENAGLEVDNNMAGTLVHALVFCGLSMEEAEVFTQRAASDWQEICHIGSASDLVKTLNKSQKKDFFIDPCTATKIKVLIHWAKWNNMTKSQAFDVRDFCNSYDCHYTRCNNCLKLKNETSKIPVPETLDSKKWKEWLRSVVNYLASVYNEIGVPLIYTVWELLGLEDKEASELTPMERFYRNTRMEGTTFQTDSTRVHQIIMNCLSDSDAYPWIAKQAKGSCGRKLLMALSDHYDGQVSMVIRAQQALASIKGASWSHEYTFSFERYSKS